MSITLHNKPLRSVLILRLSSIGDVVHALPVAAALKDQDPSIHITWVVEPMSADIVRMCPCVDEVLILESDRSGAMMEMLRTLRRREFDLSLDLQGYGKTALLAAAAGAGTRLGWFRLRDGSGLVSKSIRPAEASLHHTDRHLDVVRSIGVEAPGARFPLQPSSDAVKFSEALLADAGVLPGKGYVIANAGAGAQLKRWGADALGRLAERIEKELGYTVVLVGSKRDVPLNARVLEVGRLPQCRDLAGRTSLQVLAALLARCSLHLTGDTGSLHIAVAVGCPITAWFGPTDPRVTGPYGRLGDVVSHRNLCAEGCSPSECRRTGARNLPIDAVLHEAAGQCLSQLTVEEVFAAAAERLR
jgi:ADP-heptose:LPS heptosyltransferase